MSRTVSFRCSEELDKLLEEEAERRMTTKSTVAQMIVAEHFRGKTEQPAEETEDSEENGENEDATTEEVGGESELSENEKLLDKHSGHWYEPDGKKNNYAVEPPEGSDGKRRYYKSQEGAAKRLAEWYE
jgi:predicted transcriptional regulator